MAAGDATTDITSPNAKAGAIFDGVDDVITLSANTETLGVFTYSMKVLKRTGNNAQTRVGIIGGSPGGDNWIGFVGTSGELRMEFSDGTDAIATAGSFSSNEWVTLGYVYNGSVIDFYIDGLKVGASVASIGKTSYIGTIGTGYTIFFDGVVKDFRIFNNNLTAAQMLKIANNEDVDDNLIHKFNLTSDFNDSIGDLTGSAGATGVHIGIVDSDITKAITAARTSANDIYLISPSGNGLQATTVVIEEAP